MGLGIVVLLIAAFASRRVILEEWYISKLESTDEETRKKAAESLTEYGSERSIPPLIRAHSDSLRSLMETQRARSDALPHLERKLARLLEQQTELARRISVISRDEAQSQDVRQMAFLSEQWTALDEGLARVSRDIETVLTMDSFFESLIKITEKAKKEAIPDLTRAQQSDDWHIRWQAARLLGALGPHAKDSIPVLKTKSEDVNALVRYAATEALNKIGHEDGQ